MFIMRCPKAVRLHQRHYNIIVKFLTVRATVKYHLNVGPGAINGTPSIAAAYFVRNYSIHRSPEPGRQDIFILTFFSCWASVCATACLHIVFSRLTHAPLR